MQCNCNAICCVKECFTFFISILELIVKNSLFANAYFTKKPNKTSERLFGSLLKIFYLLEGGSLCSSPPNMDWAGKFCVFVGQKVVKWCDFLRIFDILIFCWHFIIMLSTFRNILPTLTKNPLWFADYPLLLFFLEGLEDWLGLFALWLLLGFASLVVMATWVSMESILLTMVLKSPESCIISGLINSCFVLGLQFEVHYNRNHTIYVLLETF